MLSLFQRKRPPAATAPSLTPAPDPSKGLLRPESSASLLATPRRQKLLEHIWQRTSLSRKQFATLYRTPLERYAELVQAFPASEAHHHAHPGGMLDHGLEIVAYALKLRQSHLLPIGSSPEDQAAQSEAWTAAVAYAALLHDIGKVAVDLHVELADGSTWHPWHGPLRQPYRFRYRDDREYRLHSAATGLLYRSGNAPDKRDVLGTLMLGLLAGHKRYAHMAALRGDAVAAQALGMQRIVSEDALRRALARIDEAASAAWMRPALMHSVRQALDRPWVLDIDASIKPLYGRQEGAEMGYNPSKPKRPSHVLHTFWVGNLRLVLDVQVSGGKQHTSVHAKAALGRLLDELGDERLGNRRPALVRGDSGYGNEGILVTLEERNQPYLLRLRQTKNVQRLVAQQFTRQDWSRADKQGCQMVEASLQLHGWSKKRRVVIVRQRIRGGIARERRVDGQMRLDLTGPSVHEGERLWEYAVLVTDVAYPIEAIGQLYRDRADAENGFDELKNQWGLSGFTTQDINRCQTTARACALVYNWWSWYCRSAHPQARMEAITSRPLLLAAVGRAVSHAGSTTLYLSPIHAERSMLKRLIANVGAALRHVRATAEQFKDSDPWDVLLRYVCERIAPVVRPSAALVPLSAAG